MVKLFKTKSFMAQLAYAFSGVTVFVGIVLAATQLILNTDPLFTYLDLGGTLIVVASVHIVLLIFSRVDGDYSITSNFSHEIKTPITAIDLTVQNLLDLELNLTDSLRAQIQTIARENSRLARFADVILSLILLEKEEYPFSFERSRLDRIVQQGIHSLHDKHGKNNVDISVCMPDNCPWILADQNLLALAIFQILDNAFLYSSQYENQARPIRLIVEKDDASVKLSIQDKGIGIQKRNLHRIFKKYFRVDSSHCYAAPGCGIGLAFSSLVMEKHGARITVMSRLGQGSQFSMVFPISP